MCVRLWSIKREENERLFTLAAMSERSTLYLCIDRFEREKMLSPSLILSRPTLLQFQLRCRRRLLSVWQTSNSCVIPSSEEGFNVDKVSIWIQNRSQRKGTKQYKLNGEIFFDCKPTEKKRIELHPIMSLKKEEIEKGEEEKAIWLMVGS